MQFEWKITGLVKKTAGALPGTVIEALWCVVGTDENGKVGFFRGGGDLSPPDPSNFTDFDSLTEQQVLGWVKSSIKYPMSHIEQQIRLDIERSQTKQVFGADLPWATITE